jgi:hypothetical protein
MSVPSRTVNLFQAAPSVCRSAPFAGTLFGSMRYAGTLFGGPPWAVASAPPSRPQAPQRIVARAVNQPWPSRTFSFERTPCCALRRLLHEPNVSARRAPLSLQWSSLNRHCAEFRATLRGRSIACFSPDGLMLTNMMKRPHTDIPWNRQGGALVHAAITVSVVFRPRL